MVHCFRQEVPLAFGPGNVQMSVILWKIQGLECSIPGLEERLWQPHIKQSERDDCNYNLFVCRLRVSLPVFGGGGHSLSTPALTDVCDYLCVRLHRRDSQGLPERCQHSPAHGRGLHPAVCQPHACNRGNLIGRRERLPALPLSSWDAAGRHCNQTGLCAKLCALDSHQITR